MGCMPINQQNHWTLGWNVGDKVVDNPPIKQLRYHPAIVALSEIRPSDTPPQGDCSGTIYLGRCA